MPNKATDEKQKPDIVKEMAPNVMDRASTVTDFYLADYDGKSKYGEGIIYKSIPVELKAEEQADGSVAIKGWASTKAVDLADDVIEPTAFASSLNEYMSTGTMMFMHDWWGIPIGKFDVAEVRDIGLWVEGRVLPTTQGKDVGILIQNTVLNALSVGFRVLKWSKDEDTGIRTIHDLKLYEISVVNAGMNPAALFTQAKHLELSLKSLTVSPGGGGTERKETIMSLTQEQLVAIKKAEKLADKFDESSFGSVPGDISDLKKITEEQGKLFKTLGDKQDDLAKGIVTPAEFKEGVEGLGADILDLKKDIQSIQQSRKIDRMSIPISDWKMMPSDIVFAYDDQGHPRPDIYQKAFRLFHIPVEAKTDEGLFLRNLRKCHDAVVILDAYFRSHHNGKGRYQITDLKTWRLFSELMQTGVSMGLIDPDFSKAMSAGSASLGAEWVPEEMSAELYTLYRLRPQLESFFPTWDMPSNAATWPIMTSGASLYRAAEATVNNPSQLVKSNIGTSKITFTAETYAVVVPVSPQLLEDAIIAVIGVINEEIAFAAADGYESLIVNGDNTATHFDTGAGYTSLNPETYEKGLRRLASDASKTFDTQSTTSGVGDGTAAFAAQDVRYLRKLCGKLGKRPSDGLFIFSVSAWFQSLSFTQVAKANEIGDRSTWLTGDLEAIDGTQIYVSEHVREDLNASGIYDNSVTDNTAIIFCNKPSFKIGNRRGITLEFEKNILTQQWAFVGSMRKSFQKMPPSTLYPVSVGYNINS